MIGHTINPESIVRVYSGKPGCGCGCRGTYWDDARNIRRIVKILNSRPDTRFEDGIYFAEDDARYFWAYTSS